ncbi:MAG: DJ-1/PfpI family protein [Deltaproteobacteria bacterium]|nr:DJ-1/PfpI family protein [Deltaproteobacteria bacterium]
MALSDKKALMVVPPSDFQDEEYERPRRILESRGIRVTVASNRLGEARGARGAVARIDALMSDVKYYDYDAIIFVGGEGARKFFDDEKATKLAKDAEYKILGAIGEAVGVLAHAGVLKGKTATSDRSAAGLLEEKQARFIGQPLAVDGKIVTADGPKIAEQFGNALLEQLRK